MANEIFVPGDFPTIAAAVAAANELDTIRVAPGVYNETIIVNKTIQLHGAQSGVDARSRFPLTESTITSNNASGVIQVTADNVVIDGFTVQNNSAGPGIATSPLFSGYWLFNNIIQNNVIGLFFNSSGLTFSQARYNLIQSNNQPGAATGNGIYSDQTSMDVFIDSNKFQGGHANASINFSGGAPGVQENIIIANNLMVQDNSIALTNTTNVKITNNTMLNTQGSSIFIAGGTSRTEIESNILHNSISNGISVNNVFDPDDNTNIRAKLNSIQGNTIAGLNIAAGSYSTTPPNRRLDATNNWWGNASGPAPIGTGDTVIDPEGVAEIIPFLTADPTDQQTIPGNLLSTGPIQRNGSNVQTIIVDVLNNDPLTMAVVEIRGFSMGAAGLKTPYVHEIFSLDSSTKIQKTYSVSQLEEFEFQFNITGTDAVHISLWPRDIGGALLPTQRVLTSELQQVSMLTPIP